MKLELKHLAGYLPYGLNFDGKRNGWVSFDGNIKTLCPVDLDGRWEIIKPILRPLLDLTKEIEVNGEKFVPINTLELYGYYDKQCLNLNQVKSISFDMMQHLLEWQFDIYGLIDAGLAIDINIL